MEAKHNPDSDSRDVDIFERPSSSGQPQPEDVTDQPGHGLQENLIMDFGIEENISEAVETFSRLFAFGHFAKATTFFDDVLKLHMHLIPVFAEYTNCLIQQGRYDLVLDCVKKRKATQVQFEEEEIEYLGLLEMLSVLHVEGQLVETLKALDAHSASYFTWLSIPIEDLSGTQIRSIETYIEIIAAVISVMPGDSVQVAHNITITVPEGKSFIIFGGSGSAESHDPWVQLQSWCFSLQVNHPLEAHNIFRTLLDVLPSSHITEKWVKQFIGRFPTSQPLARLAAVKAKTSATLSVYRRKHGFTKDEEFRGFMNFTGQKHISPENDFYTRESGDPGDEENVQRYAISQLHVEARLIESLRGHGIDDLETITAIAREEANYRLESICIQEMIGVDLGKFKLWLAAIAPTSKDPNIAYHHLIHSAVELVIYLGQLHKSNNVAKLPTAVWIGSLAGSRLLIERGNSIEERGTYSMTALHHAASKGHTAVAQMLLGRNPAPLSSRDCYGRLPLHIAAQHGHDDFVQLLLDVDKTKLLLEEVAKGGRGVGFQNATPLHLAAIRGHEQVVSTLLRHSTKVEREDAAKDTPLHKACAAWQYGVAFLLLRHGAKVNPENAYGETPLILAVRNGHTALVELLLSYDADLRKGDNGGRSVLHFAAESGDEDVLKLLLQHGADISTISYSGQTVLYFAAKEGHSDVVSYLLTHEVVRMQLSRKESYAESPLSMAAENGHTAVVQILLDNGAFVEEDTRGRTPLLLAARFGHDAVVSFLLEKGANIEAKDRSEETSLSIAAGKGHEAVVRILLEKGADIETRDRNEKTPLLVAAGGGHEAVARFLLEKGADIEATDDGDKTPLSLAVAGGHEAVVRLLVEKGAKKDVKNTK